MRLLNKIHCTILIAGLGLLTGCDQQLTAEQETQKQQLINQSLNNMVFIEGGSFMMGDFGGHDGRSTRSYTFEKDNKAFHKVTLDSFSMAKYPVTWREFNLWIALTGPPLQALSTAKKKRRFHYIRKSHCPRAIYGTNRLAKRQGLLPMVRSTNQSTH